MQPRERLTMKEMQVAALVREGQTNREIAKAIGTTEQVVKSYLRNTFDKLSVWSHLELAIYVAQHGGEHWREDFLGRAVDICPGRLLSDWIAINGRVERCEAAGCGDEDEDGGAPFLALFREVWPGHRIEPPYLF